VGATQVAFNEVSAWLWVAKAGLVLVSASDMAEPKSAFSINLAHEYAFLQGQGKPVLLLVDRRCRADVGLENWSIAHGVVRAYFDHEHASDRTHAESIPNLVKEWASQMRDLRD
jgi:hypothetical protein